MISPVHSAPNTDKFKGIGTITTSYLAEDNCFAVGAYDLGSKRPPG